MADSSEDSLEGLTLQRTSEEKLSARPVARLPRSRGRDENGVTKPPQVELFVEIARGVAGCCVCDTPIPAGGHRLKIRLRFPEPRQVGERTIMTDSYYVHPGCITDRVRPEVLRSGFDCFVCGKRHVMNDDDAGHIARHPGLVFTVSKFAPAPICAACMGKPHLRQCHMCAVYYPVWMVERVTEDQKFGVDLEEWWTDAGDDICVNCRTRYDIRTVETLASEVEAWKTERERIRREGL